MNGLFHAVWTALAALATPLAMGQLALFIYQRRKVNPTQEDIDRGDGPIITWLLICLIGGLAIVSLIYGLFGLVHR